MHLHIIHCDPALANWNPVLTPNQLVSWASAGESIGWPEADGGEQGTPAKAGARSCRRHTAGTAGVLYVGVVIRAHLRGVCTTVQQVWQAGPTGWVHHRAGDGAAATGTCWRVKNCTGNRTGALTTTGAEWTAAGGSGRGV